MKKKRFTGLVAVLALALVLTPLAFVRADNDKHDNDDEKVKASLSASVLAEVQGIDTQIKSLQDQLETLKKKRNDLISQNKPQSNGQVCKELRSQLRAGMQGDEIKALQEALADDPDIFPMSLVTGFFGPATKQAVIKFQMKHGLNAVGEVGPQTRALLMVKLKTRCGNINLPPIAVPLPTTTPTTTPGGPVFKVNMCQNPGTTGQVNVEVPISDVFAKIQAGFKIGKCATTATTTPPVVDTTAPTNTELAANSIATTTAKVRWVTNEGAKGKVWYGTNSPLTAASASIENTNLLTVHEFVLTGLNASTTYYFKVESKDAAGNTSTSSELNFTTTH